MVMTTLQIIQQSHFKEQSQKKGKVICFGKLLTAFRIKLLQNKLFKSTQGSLGTNLGAFHPTEEDDEDEELCHSAHWQSSEQLSVFLGTLHKPLSAFESAAKCPQ